MVIGIVGLRVLVRIEIELRLSRSRAGGVEAAVIAGVAEGFISRDCTKHSVPKRGKVNECDFGSALTHLPNAIKDLLLEGVARSCVRTTTIVVKNEKLLGVGRW